MVRIPGLQFLLMGSLLLTGSCSARANPGLDGQSLDHPSLDRQSYDRQSYDSQVAFRSNIKTDAFAGPFAVPSVLRKRVDFWKDIFAKYGAAQSVIHHRDFPQIVFGVIDLSREYDTMSPISFDAYKTAVVKRTLEDLQGQLLELSSGQDARTPFQRRVLSELEQRGLPNSVTKTWVEQDLIRTQTGIRERYAEAMRRAWRYLPVMEQIFVSEYGLPKELTRMPFIESSFDYTAYSSVGAAGIWQFMPRTARSHRMVVGKHIDERRDPIRATRAAAEYLRTAYNSLGSWPLAVTSYNHGVGGVRSKVRAAGTDDLAAIIEDPYQRYFGFASTNFYPELLAAIEIFQDYKRYFPEIREEPPLRVVSYSMRGSVGAQSLAGRLGIPMERLREANYGLLESVWSGRAAIPSGYTLRVPVEYRSRADQLLGRGVPEHVVAVGSTQGDQEEAAEVIEGNRMQAIESDVPQVRPLEVDVMTIEQGATVPARSVGASSKPRAVGASQSPDKRKRVALKSVKVRPGDSLSSLAKRHGVGVDRLKQLNNLRGSKVFAGQTLLVPK